jgi:hypothetical protein
MERSVGSLRSVCGWQQPHCNLALPPTRKAESPHPRAMLHCMMHHTDTVHCMWAFSAKTACLVVLRRWLLPITLGLVQLCSSTSGACC